MTNLGIVIPCFNEELALRETVRQILELRARLVGIGKISAESRIYFVDDGSRDGTWAEVESFVRSGLPVIGIKLSRNRGHQNALLAGLLGAQGDALVSLDADLQDDISAIERMLDLFHQGIDIVYGVRRQRETDSLFKRSTAKVFYRLIAGMGAPTVDNHADYRLMSRRAIDALKDYREVNLFLRGIIPLIGLPSATVEYDRAARVAGQSKYPLRRMLSLALDAVTSFSVFPLRLISVLGFLIFVGTMFVSGWALWAALFNENAVPGWASTVLPMYFLGGVQLLCLGVLGEYLGKLYIEAKARPRYVIERIAQAKDAGYEPTRIALGEHDSPTATRAIPATASGRGYSKREL